MCTLKLSNQNTVRVFKSKFLPCTHDIFFFEAVCFLRDLATLLPSGILDLQCLNEICVISLLFFVYVSQSGFIKKLFSADFERAKKNTKVICHVHSYISIFLCIFGSRIFVRTSTQKKNCQVTPTKFYKISSLRFSILLLILIYCLAIYQGNMFKKNMQVNSVYLYTDFFVVTPEQLFRININLKVK